MKTAIIRGAALAAAAALALAAQPAQAHSVTFTIAGDAVVNDGDPLAAVENRPAATHAGVAFRNAGASPRAVGVRIAADAPQGLGCRVGDGPVVRDLALTIPALGSVSATCTAAPQGTLYTLTDGAGLRSQFRVSPGS